MTTSRLDNLEERIEKPGYLLLLVFVLLLLIIGLVDLIDYIGEEPVLFGRYSVRYFMLLVGYTLFTLAWASLLLKPNNDRLFRKVIDTIQMHPILAVAILAGMVLVIVMMGRAADTVEGAMVTLPAFQLVVLTLILLFAAIILFYGWGDPSRPQLWRKIVLAVLGVALAIELIVQALAYFGVFRTDLATTESAEYYSPYNRIYHGTEGFGSGLTNNYGQYAPEFELLPDSQRIVVLGDSMVGALQVKKEEHFANLLETRIAADAAPDAATEVLPVAYPDLGPGIYLSSWLTEVMDNTFEPAEAIVFFDMRNDFQLVDSAGQGAPYYFFNENGQIELDNSREYGDYHEAEHFFFRAYKGFQPILILKTNYLTPRLIQTLLGGGTDDNSPPPGIDANPVNADIDLPNSFVFDPATNEHALKIAAAQFVMARDMLEGAGVAGKIVTNPAFTEAFYAQDTWNTVFGDSDLLLPERQLLEAAQRDGVPFLGLGLYMAAQGLSPADVQAFYYKDGLGHFTPAGHAFAADAIYQCFYAQTASVQAGCYVP